MVNVFIDHLAHFCLKFGHITFILPLVIVCIIFHKRDIYAKAACFLLWVMIFKLLCCLGFSLIHCHFHNLTDVLGAVGFTLTELLIYHVISINFGDKVVGIISIASAVAVMFALSVIHRVEFHVWLAFYALLGMETVLTVTQEKKLNSVRKKFLALILSIIMIASVYYIFKILAFDKFYLSEIRFALIPLIIIGSIQFSERVKV